MHNHLPVISALLFFSFTPALTADTANSSSPKEYHAEEALFTREAQAFYKKHIEYLKKIHDEKKVARNQLNALRARRDSNGPAVKNEIAQLELRLLELNENSAEHEVETAEFGMEVAVHRLEVAKKNLAQVQERRKKASQQT